MDCQIERRKHPRFAVKSDVLAILKPYPVKLGKIADISESGLSFQYLGSDELPAHYSVIDLFVTQDDQEYRSFPIQKLREITLSKVYEKTVPIRQIGIMFNDLTPDQAALLRLFITAHTD